MTHNAPSTRTGPLTLPGTRALPWLDSFGVGRQDMDDEHRGLLTACNELCELAQDDPGYFHYGAKALIAMLERHFAHEEALFPQIGYRRCLSHMREHLSVISSLNTLLLGPAALEPAVAATTSRLVLVEHILRHDLEFKTWALHAEGR